MPLAAGFAEIEITPPVGAWMGGYAFRPSGCTSIHDPLFARAAVFERSGRAVAIIAADLIGLDRRTVDAVRVAIEQATGIPGAAVMLNCSHTHGGPLTMSFRTMGTPDPVYMSRLSASLVDVVKAAVQNLQRATLSLSRSTVQIGVNRRQYGERSEDTRIGVNPTGPSMPRVDSLLVSDTRGKPLALLFTHACHPTTLGGDNLALTADFPGFACAEIRRVLGSDVLPMFLQGCCGNINPHPRDTFELAERHGRALGNAALAAPQSAPPVDVERIAFAEVTVDLPLVMPERESSERDLLHWEAEIERWKREGRVEQVMHAEGMRDQALFELEAGQLAGDRPLKSQFTIQRLSLGPLQILGLPAEMFVQYALDFDRQSSRPVFSLGYTNGVQGYVPAAADYPWGGYEVYGAHRYYAMLPYDSTCERRIRSAAYPLLGVSDPDGTPYAF